MYRRRTRVDHDRRTARVERDVLKSARKTVLSPKLVMCIVTIILLKVYKYHICTVHGGGVLNRV